jgi:rod shape-determining protein MreC
VARSRAEGIVEWKSGSDLELSFIPFRADVKAGDQLITSGLGGVFPRGIPVGKVKEIESDPKSGSSRITIETACDFSALEEVFVVMGGSPFESMFDEPTPAEIAQE